MGYKQQIAINKYMAIWIFKFYTNTKSIKLECYDAKIHLYHLNCFKCTLRVLDIEFEI